MSNEMVHNTVLETTGVPVTGTPSISLEFNFIDGEPSINDVLNRWRTCDRYTCISRTVIGEQIPIGIVID